MWACCSYVQSLYLGGLGDCMTLLQLTPLEAARWVHHRLYADRLRGKKSLLAIPFYEPSVEDLEFKLISGLNSSNSKRPLSELVS